MERGECMESWEVGQERVGDAFIWVSVVATGEWAKFAFVFNRNLRGVFFCQNVNA